MNLKFKMINSIYLFLLFIIIYSAKAEDTLRITSPLGNEKYLLGSNIIILWTGIPIQDTVIIKLSTDFGKNWNVITDTAWGGTFKWKIIDKKLIGKICKFTVQSKKVLPFDPLKIECHTIIKPFINDTNNLTKKTSLVNTFDLSSSGYELASQSYETSFWDVLTGNLKKRIYLDSFYIDLNNHRGLTNIKYNSNDSIIAISTKSLRTINTKDYKVSNSYDLGTSNYNSWYLNFSPNSNLFLFLSDFGYNCIDTKTFNLKYKVNIYGQYDNLLDKPCSISPDGTNFAVKFDKDLLIYDLTNGSLLSKTDVGLWLMQCLSYSSDGTKIFIAGAIYINQNRTFLINIYDTRNKKLISSINTQNNVIQTATFSPDGKYILVGTCPLWGTKGSILIYNSDNGNLIREIPALESPLTRIRFNKLGNILATSSEWEAYDNSVNNNPDSTTKVWFVCQKDTSKIVSVEKANLISKDINMGTIETNTLKDSLVSSFIFNFSDLPVHIDNISLSGALSNQFEVLSSMPFDIPANGNYAVKFRFKPSSTGFKNANILIQYQGIDTLIQRISGNATGFDVTSNKIDFGSSCINSVKDSFQIQAIKNNSTMPITIKKVSLINPDGMFNLLTNSNSFTLGIDQSYKVDMRYLPTQIGKHSATIKFEIIEKDTSIFTEIFGNGTNNITKINYTTNKFCIGSSIVLSANPKLPNTSYLWNTGETTDSIIVSKAGKYWLYSLLDSKCEARDTIEVFEYPKPFVNIIGLEKFCMGKSVVLSSDIDFKSYKWNTGETTKSILANKAGIYTLNVFDINGCQANASHTITQNEMKFTVSPNILNHGEIEIGESSEIKLKIENQSANPINIEKMYFSSNNKELANNQTIGTYEVSDYFLPNELKDYNDTLIVVINQPCDTTIKIIKSGVGIAYSIIYTSKLEGVPNSTDFEIPILKRQSKNYGTNTSKFTCKVGINREFYTPTSSTFTNINTENISNINGTLTGILADTLYRLKGNILFASEDITPINLSEFKAENPRWKITTENGELKLVGVCSQNIRKVEFLKDYFELKIQNQELIISIDSELEGTFEIDLYNLLGNKMFTQSFENKNSKHITNIPISSNGIYYYLIKLSGYPYRSGVAIVVE